MLFVSDVVDFSADGLDSDLDPDFESVLLPPLASGLRWDNSLLLTGGVLQVVAGLAGDYNANGVVDAADYVVWRQTAGTSGAGLAADGNGDFHVDEHDYALWLLNVGASLPAGSARSAIAPEPGSAFLLITAGVGALLLPASNR